jgi:GNAT superfamily N-acetyltransferase
MRFAVGCDMAEFKEYWNRSGYNGSLDHLINEVIKEPSQLIVWRENGKIVRHAVWHETSTDEHRRGVPRANENTQTFEKLLGEKKNFVELHELWLTKEYMGRGYGTEFFEFFEDLMKDKGFDDIVFYADHPAALAICRKRGYKEGGHLNELREYVFSLTLGKRK